MSDGYNRVRGVIDALLAPGGCPWDRKQTPESLCDYVIEEAYELVEAIRAGDVREVAEELGDVAFLLLFIGRLFEEAGEFSTDQALQANAQKMIRRHPHVFEDTQFESQDELLRNWERIKREEKNDREDSGSRWLLDSVPAGLPPVLRAYRLHSKAARVGFTWENDAQLETQLQGEWQELQEVLPDVHYGEDGAPVQDENLQRLEHEYGDYLFTLVEWGRRKGLKANAALHKANMRFQDRVQAMERIVRAEHGKELAELGLEELNQVWERVKDGE